MTMPAPDLPAAAGAMASAIAWLYLLTNSARVVSYLPQIIAIWRCRDGAHSISLLTWGYWMMSHLTAVLYGSVVVRDAYFIAISAMNLTCCAAVTCLAARRRGLLTIPGRQARPGPAAPDLSFKADS
jgi:uncharacterized protein with PQ loop repeat